METIVSEIIVAKHRHGPTGSVELIFFPHKTQFADAATRIVDTREPPPEARP
jgi:replicative DNA helicase